MLSFECTRILSVVSMTTFSVKKSVKKYLGQCIETNIRRYAIDKGILSACFYRIHFPLLFRFTLEFFFLSPWYLYIWLWSYIWNVLVFCFIWSVGLSCDVACCFFGSPKDGVPDIDCSPGMLERNFSGLQVSLSRVSFPWHFPHFVVFSCVSCF